MEAFQQDGGKLQGALLVAHDNQALLSCGYGFQNEEAGVINHQNSQFLIGSMSLSR